MSDIKKIEPLILKKISSLGFELFGLKYFKAGSHAILRVFIDKEGGITISDCELVSNELSMLLDLENFSNRPYTLEVSSPGINRSLQTEKDFSRIKGKKIRVQIKDEEREGKTITVVGKVFDCSNGLLHLETEEGVKLLALSHVINAKIEVTFK